MTHLHFIINLIEIRTKSMGLVLDKRQAEILNEVFWQSLRFVKNALSLARHAVFSIVKFQLAKQLESRMPERLYPMLFPLETVAIC